MTHINYDINNHDGWLLGSSYDSRETFRLSEEAVDALRKYFQDERDRELGRWRSPDFPGRVAYPLGGFDESWGRSIWVVDEIRATSYVMWEVLGVDDPFTAAYFEANPPEESWEKAKPGEIWGLTGQGGVEHPWLRTETSWESCLNKGWAYSAERIIAGRKVWPKGGK